MSKQKTIPSPQPERLTVLGLQTEINRLNLKLSRALQPKEATVRARYYVWAPYTTDINGVNNPKIDAAWPTGVQETVRPYNLFVFTDGTVSYMEDPSYSVDEGTHHSIETVND